MPETRPVIACMKWGTRYGPEFVNRLYSAVARNMNRPFRFICFTDDNSDIHTSVETHPLPSITLPDRVAITPWRKLSLWQVPLADIITGDVLVLDLDLVVTGNLDPFFTYEPGQYCVIENWTQPGKKIGNTSVFRIPVGRFETIFSSFTDDPEKVLSNFRIEQQFISHHIPEQKFWPSKWCLSFKHSLLPPFPINWVKAPQLPSTARIVAFTGHPDPDEARDGHWQAPWYKRHYKHIRPTPWIAEHWR